MAKSQQGHKCFLKFPAAPDARQILPIPRALASCRGVPCVRRARGQAQGQPIQERVLEARNWRCEEAGLIIRYSAVR
jgi:hypothetical protein